MSDLIDKAEALAPCPFCGGKAEMWNARDNRPAWIACMGRCAVLISKEHTTDAAAIAAWNRRALPARGVGVPTVDELVNLIRRVDGQNSLGAGALAEAILAALAPTDAAHVNETPKSKHDGADVLTAAQAREAAFLGVCECGMTGPCMWDQCQHPITREART